MAHPVEAHQPSAASMLISFGRRRCIERGQRDLGKLREREDTLDELLTSQPREVIADAFVRLGRHGA